MQVSILPPAPTDHSINQGKCRSNRENPSDYWRSGCGKQPRGNSAENDSECGVDDPKEPRAFLGNGARGHVKSQAIRDVVEPLIIERAVCCSNSSVFLCNFFILSRLSQKSRVSQPWKNRDFTLLP
jgi:hypothetical protein